MSWLGMKLFVEAAGAFIYPLGLCSFVAVFLIVERLLALFPGRVIPPALSAFLADPAKHPRPPAFARSTGGRIVAYFIRTRAEGAQLKAYAQFELSRLERGVFLLDTIVGIAPLIGLLGTVYGLFMLFPEEGLPKATDLTRGVGLALTTTIIGLFIAIPSLLFTNWIGRRIELLSARINLLVERVLALGDELNPARPAAEPPPLAAVATAPATPAANAGEARPQPASPNASDASGATPPPLPPASAPAQPSAPAPSADSAPTVLAPDGTRPPPRPAPRKLEFELKPLASATNRPARKP